MTTIQNDRPSALVVNASGRRQESQSRAIVAELLLALEERHGPVDVTDRDLAAGVPVVDERWIDANSTPEEDRSGEQRSVLANSDRLVAELQAADIVVIGAPIYNFGVPASLKAWIDMIARARVTFRYSTNGPVGLLQNKKAYLVVASGGVAVDSAVDFATPYLRQVLRFIGITDVDVIAATQINARGSAALDDARAQIDERIRNAAPPTGSHPATAGNE